jgi:Fic family protein
MAVDAAASEPSVGRKRALRGDHAFRVRAFAMPGEATASTPSIPIYTPCLDAWERYVHADDDIPPLIRCAQLHYTFQAIHPFDDGQS